MTDIEKEIHVSKYDTLIFNVKDRRRFCKHVQHFLQYKSGDDEIIAEVLDFMYIVLILQATATETQTLSTISCH